MSIVSQTFGVAGQVGVTPRRVQLTVTDNFTAITTPGYLTEKGISPYAVYPTDVFDIQYNYNAATGTGTYGEFTCTVSVPGVITLIPFGSTSANIVFTPLLAFGGSSTGITYSQNEGVFTTVGNILYFSLFMQLTSKGSQTGTATVTGLPFNALNGVIPELFSLVITYTGIPKGLIQINTSVIQLGATQVDGSVVNFNNSNFANNSALTVTGTYIYKNP